MLQLDKEGEKQEGEVDAAVADDGAHEGDDVADEEEAEYGQEKAKSGEW